MDTADWLEEEADEALGFASHERGRAVARLLAAALRALEAEETVYAHVLNCAVCLDHDAGPCDDWGSLKREAVEKRRAVRAQADKLRTDQEAASGEEE